MAIRPSSSTPGEHPEGTKGVIPSIKPIHRLRRFVVRVAIPTLAYVGVIAIFTGFQARLIFPGSETQGKPESVVTPPRYAELVDLKTARGDRIVALFGRALNADGSLRADASARPTILFFYGNAMCLKDATEDLERFRRLGANVLIPEYLGYGMSGGEPGELGCRETAEAALAHLLSRPDVDPTRIVASGWSLGGAVAIDLASRHKLAGLATFCTFTRMADMASRVLPFLPTSLLLRHRFENLSKIAKVGGPVLIGHGRVDRIIPFEMADRLASAAPGPVVRVTIDDADHNDFFRVGGLKVTTSVRSFLEGLSR